MTTLRTLLREADPLVYEPRRSAETRERSRQIVLDPIQDREQPSRRLVLRSLVAALVIAGVTAATSYWPRSSGDLIAAVRFEIQVNQEIVIVNGDIAEARVVPGQDASTFNVEVELTPEGADKLWAATERNVGRSLAIVVDGEVLAAPRVTSPISSEALISGNFSEAEAERIATGILGK